MNEEQYKHMKERVNKYEQLDKDESIAWGFAESIPLCSTITFTFHGKGSADFGNQREGYGFYDKELEQQVLEKINAAIVNIFQEEALKLRLIRTGE